MGHIPKSQLEAQLLGLLHPEILLKAKPERGRNFSTSGNDGYVRTFLSIPITASCLCTITHFSSSPSTQPHTACLDWLNPSDYSGLDGFDGGALAHSWPCQNWGYPSPTPSRSLRAHPSPANPTKKHHPHPQLT